MLTSYDVILYFTYCTLVPTPSLGLHLQDSEFRFCLRYWLGVPMHSNPFPCPECRGTADIMGDHQVGCGGNGDRISRHNAIRDVLFTAAQSAALAPSKETQFSLKASRHPPPQLVPRSSSCPRHPRHFPPPAVDPGEGSLHPWLCPTSRDSPQVGLQPLGLPCSGS